ncbi:MAG TPA: OmpH family outer membrane protein [Phycisphaerales bacterium]|jgi:Skp family chaperone for outer membrane proteins|nr:OmpH family outer membrane protein [Phycisphaerales bacterium]
MATSNGGWKRVAGIAGCCAALAAAIVGSGVIGARSARAGFAPSNQAPIVAIVDLETVINSLDEQKSKQRELEDNAKAEEARLKSFAEQVEGEKKALDGLTGDARATAERKFRDDLFKLEFERQLATRNLNIRGGEMLRDLYMKVDAAAENLAKKNGYDLVLVSDEKAPIPQDDQAAARRAMLLKRMLYVNPTLDITQELVQTMNNEFAMGKR